MVNYSWREFLELRVNLFSLQSSSTFVVKNLNEAVTLSSMLIYKSLKDGEISLTKALIELDKAIEKIATEGHPIIDYVHIQNPKLCLYSVKNNQRTYKLVRIIDYNGPDDCIKKLKNKVKLEKLISIGQS